MASPKKESIELLIEQLAFLQSGGYTPRKDGCSPRLLQDSPSCPNFQRSESERTPCAGCELLRFVPPKDRAEARPCQHIQLNAQKETPEMLFFWGTPAEQKVKLRHWLVNEIFRLTESKRQQQKQFICDAT